MAKPIPSGGKRERQVKVNFNDLELARLDVYSNKIGSDRASILRNNFFSFIHIHDEVLDILKELEKFQRSTNKNNSLFQKEFDVCIKQLSQVSDVLISSCQKIQNSKTKNEFNTEKFKEDILNQGRKLDLGINKIFNIREKMLLEESIRTKEINEYIVRLEELFSNPEVLARKTLDNLDDPTVNKKQKIILTTITTTDHVYKVLDFLRDGLPILVDFSKIESDDLISLIFENLKVGSYALSSEHYLLSNNFVFFLPKGMNLNHKDFSEDTKPKIPTLGEAVSGAITSSKRAVGRGLVGLANAIGTEEQRIFWRGRDSFEQEDYVGAIKELTAAIKLDPNYDEAFLLRGKAKDELEDYQGAIKDFSEAIELNPDDEEAFLLREKAKEKEKDKKLEKDTSTEKTLQDNAKQRLSKVRQAAQKAKEKEKKLEKDKKTAEEKKLKKVEKLQIEMLKSRPPTKSRASIPQKNARELRRKKPSKSYEQLKKDIR